HDRRGGHRNAAAVALPGETRDLAVLDRDAERDLVSARGVQLVMREGVHGRVAVALGGLRVIQDQFLVHLLKRAAHRSAPKNPRTSASAAPKAATSSSVE